MKKYSRNAWNIGQPITKDSLNAMRQTLMQLSQEIIGATNTIGENGTQTKEQEQATNTLKNKLNNMIKVSTNMNDTNYDKILINSAEHRQDAIMMTLADCFSKYSSYQPVKDFIKGSIFVSPNNEIYQVQQKIDKNNNTQWADINTTNNNKYIKKYLLGDELQSLKNLVNWIGKDYMYLVNKIENTDTNKNLFNPFTVNRCHKLTNQGQLEYDSSYDTTDYIPIQKNKYIHISCLNFKTHEFADAYNGIISLAFYDSNYKLLWYKIRKPDNEEINPYKVISSSNTNDPAYFRMTYSITGMYENSDIIVYVCDDPQFKLKKETYQPHLYYTPYRYTYEKVKEANNKIINLASYINYIDNFLMNKFPSQYQSINNPTVQLESEQPEEEPTE